MNPAQAPSGRSRELELELTRVRAAATAARLEARAAEIELLLAQCQRRSDAELMGGSRGSEPDGEPSSSPSPTASAISAETRTVPLSMQRQQAADWLLAAIHQLLTQPNGSFQAGREPNGSAHDLLPCGIADITGETPGPAGAEVFSPTPIGNRPDDSPSVLSQSRQQQFANGWDTRLNELRQRIATEPSHSDVTNPTAEQDDVATAHSSAPADLAHALDELEPTPPVGPPPTAQPASPQPDSPRPEFLTAPSTSAADDEPRVKPTARNNCGSTAAKPVQHAKPSTPATEATVRETLTIPTIQLQGSAVTSLHGVAAQDLQLTDETAVAPESRRWRPAAWLTSTVAHLVVLLILGMLSLSHQQPRDQLAFSAAASEAPPAVETFTIETSESLPEETQTEPTDEPLELSTMDVVSVADLSLTAPTVTPVAAVEMLSSRTSASSSLSKLLKGAAGTNAQFAGVEGGGNHFVYLVDSSKSMRNFNEARNELLRSIDALQAHQRFYVVFYDESPAYMRLSGGNADEPTSVLATDANKRALRRWAMTIQQQPGKSPTEVLPFAFKLRADVIFLLSDGEFAAQTEEVIRKHNRRDNLFGEDGPISIIHTIRYPGYSASEARKAEEQMKRIAEENGGQYRNVVLQ